MIALKFLNVLRHKKHNRMGDFLDPKTFEDVLPNGTVVKSSAQLLTLHEGFMQNKTTGFRPFDWKREFIDWETGKSEDRDFCETDLEYLIELESGYFCRVAAEVDRPADFRILDSEITRHYMYLGILVKGNYIVHIQNTPFDPRMKHPR